MQKGKNFNSFLIFTELSHICHAIVIIRGHSQIRTKGQMPGNAQNLELKMALSEYMQNAQERFGDPKWVNDNGVNPTGQLYKNWTSDSLKKLPAKDVEVLQIYVATGNPEVWTLLPDSFRKGVSEDVARAEFAHAILREAARRGQANDYMNAYIKGYVTDHFKLPYDRVTLATQIPAQRPVISWDGKAGGVPTQIKQLPPAALATFDRVLDCVETGLDNNPQNDGKTYLRADVLNAVMRANGINKPVGDDKVTTIGDHGCFAAGYQLASMPEFSDVKYDLKLENLAAIRDIGVKVWGPNAIQQESSADSVIAGFVQGRLDKRSNYAGAEPMYTIPQKAVATR